MRNTTKQAKERTEEQKDHAPKQNANVMDWENAAKTVKYFRGAKPEKERFTLCAFEFDRFGCSRGVSNLVTLKIK